MQKKVGESSERIKEDQPKTCFRTVALWSLVKNQFQDYGTLTSSLKPVSGPWIFKIKLGFERCGLVVKALDSRPEDRGFEPHLTLDGSAC